MFSSRDKKYYVPVEVHLHLLTCRVQGFGSSTAGTAATHLKDQQNRSEISKQNLAVIRLRRLQITG